MKTLTNFFSIVALAIICVSAGIDAACSPYTFANGSKVSFINTQQLAAEFKRMAQLGLGSGDYDWSMSLCDPSVQDPNAPECAKGNYMTQNSACDVKISGAPTISITSDDSTLIFTFPEAKQGESGNTWSNIVTCACDTSGSGLASPSNTYNVSLQAQNVTAKWLVTSPACCIDGSVPTAAPEHGLTDLGVGIIVVVVCVAIGVIGWVAWSRRGTLSSDAAAKAASGGHHGAYSKV